MANITPLAVPVPKTFEVIQQQPGLMPISSYITEQPAKTYIDFEHQISFEESDEEKEQLKKKNSENCSRWFPCLQFFTGCVDAVTDLFISIQLVSNGCVDICESISDDDDSLW